MVELKNDELENINGGIAFIPAVIAVTAVVTLFNVSYEAGRSIGKTIYYVTH